MNHPTNTADIPRTVDDITASWLTTALSNRYPGIEVSRIVDLHVIWGTATKVLADIEYATAPPPGGPSTHLCIKGEFDERVRATIDQWSTTPTQLEAAFYDHLAPRLTVPLSPVYYTAAQKGIGGVLIMDNLTEHGAQFGDPTHPWSPEAVARGLHVLASLHGSTWGQDFTDIDFIDVGSPTVRSAVEALFSPQHWDTTLGGADAPPIPPALYDRERIWTAYQRAFTADAANASSIVHGDAHLGNALRTRNGDVLFIDWAGPCLAPWSFDVAYFLTGSLTIEDRRHHERDLLENYLQALATSGGPDLDRTEAWDNYRAHQLHGIIWSMLPPTLQSRDAVHAMTERYTAAIQDHHTLELLAA
jgi:hypothetical protein